MNSKTGAKHIPEQDSIKTAHQRVYYTPQEVADLWKCSTATIYELLRRGKLVGFKVGRDWRITGEAVLAYEQNPENQNPRPYPRSKQPAPTVMRVV